MICLVKPTAFPEEYEYYDTLILRFLHPFQPCPVWECIVSSWKCIYLLSKDTVNWGLQVADRLFLKTRRCLLMKTSELKEREFNELSKFIK